MDLIIIVVKKKGKFELLLVGRYVYTQLMFFLLIIVYGVHDHDHGY